MGSNSSVDRIDRDVGVISGDLHIGSGCLHAGLRDGGLAIPTSPVMAISMGGSGRDFSSIGNGLAAPYVQEAGGAAAPYIQDGRRHRTGRDSSRRHDRVVVG
jgi:hypothetical protein